MHDMLCLFLSKVDITCKLFGDGLGTTQRREGFLVRIYSIRQVDILEILRCYLNPQQRHSRHTLYANSSCHVLAIFVCLLERRGVCAPSEELVYFCVGSSNTKVRVRVRIERSLTHLLYEISLHYISIYCRLRV